MCKGRKGNSMARARESFVNQKFGSLVILGDAPNEPGKKRRVLAQCECGSQKTFALKNLKTGSTQSCGCKRLDSIRIASTRHGMSHSREHRCWSSMKNRCENPNNHAFKDYGARGITVCSAWQSFELFYADMGPCPDGMSLDRIYNDGPYSKENCRWVSMVEQSNNRRSSKVLKAGGKSLTLVQWSRETNIPESTITNRLKRGWSLERALTP